MVWTKWLSKIHDSQHYQVNNNSKNNNHTATTHSDEYGQTKEGRQPKVEMASYGIYIQRPGWEAAFGSREPMGGVVHVGL